MKKYQIELEPGKFYHIYNRGNNSEKIFFNQENYKFFLRRYNEYLSSCVETYAFCLLPNHFHFLIKVKEGNADAKKALHLGDDNAKALHLGDAKLFATPATAFHRLFTSYSKAINKQQKRHGSLIENPFKRIEIDTREYLINLILYIHTNPQIHGFVNDFRTYSWSSYNDILSNEPTILKRDSVLDWFDEKDNFQFCHEKKINLEALKKFTFD